VSETSPAPKTGLLAYCRAGFEGECAQELSDHATRHSAYGFARTQPNSALVEFVLADPEQAAQLHASMHSSDLIFARQILRLLAHFPSLPIHDRIGALLPLLKNSDTRYCDAWIETPDTDAGKELSAFCRAFNAALIGVLKREKLIDRSSTKRLHVCFIRTDAAFLAESDIRYASSWPQGIPRLKFPREAPSRSTLKLDEAFQVLLSETERERSLRPGMSAVDLGAAPGGWSWQLVRRSIHVTAIDNGPMDQALLDSGLLTHLREDGFRYQPKRPADWLVCDMVEKPRRVAELIAQWLAAGWCRQAIFNLKLPMKQRYNEIQLCLALIRDHVAAEGKTVELRAKQLYHDREEITVFAQIGAR